MLIKFKKSIFIFNFFLYIKNGKNNFIKNTEMDQKIRTV